MAVLADKEQSFVRTISRASMSTHRTRLPAVVCIHFDSHALMQERFVGNHAVQLSKAPFGRGGIGFPLLPAGLFALLATGSLANVCQIFQAEFSCDSAHQR